MARNPVMIFTETVAASNGHLIMIKILLVSSSCGRLWQGCCLTEHGSVDSIRFESCRSSKLEKVRFLDDVTSRESRQLKIVDVARLSVLKILYWFVSQRHSLIRQPPPKPKRAACSVHACADRLRQTCSAHISSLVTNDNQGRIFLTVIWQALN
jgi:hypothetical protein